MGIQSSHKILRDSLTTANSKVVSNKLSRVKSETIFPQMKCIFYQASLVTEGQSKRLQKHKNIRSSSPQRHKIYI